MSDYVVVKDNLNGTPNVQVDATQVLKHCEDWANLYDAEWAVKIDDVPGVPIVKGAKQAGKRNTSDDTRDYFLSLFFPDIVYLFRL